MSNGDGSCIVTPGLVPADGHVYDDADFRALGAPVVKVADRSIGTDQMDPALISSMGGGGKVNYFSNPNFSPGNWPLGIGPRISPSGVYTELANGWGVKPSAGRVTQQRSSTVTTIGGDALKSVYSLQILGDSTSTGTVELKTDIAQYLAASLRATLAISFHVYNGTGAAITPSLVFSTPTTADDFSTVVSVATRSLSALPNAQWTKVSIDEIDSSAWGDLDKGLRISLVLPASCLDAIGKAVFVCQFKLELVAASEFFPEPEPQQLHANENFLLNGNFENWAYTGTTPTEAAALNWFGLMVRSTDQALTGSTYLAKLTGTGSAADFGQIVPGYDTKQALTFSCWVYNNSAAEVTPVLRVDLVGGANQFSSSLTPCPVAAWTKLTCTIPAGGYAVTSAGLKIYLRMTIGNSQNVYLAQVKLEPGTVATRFKRTVETPVPQPLVGYRGLSIVSRVSNGVIEVKADYLLLSSASGLYKNIPAFDRNCTPISAGQEVIGVGGLDVAGIKTANTWLYIYAIADNNGTYGVILSQSSDAPTLPAGYCFYLRLGALRTRSDAGLPNFVQKDNRAFCVRQHETIGGILGTAVGNTELSSVTITSFVPPIAKTVNGIAGVTTSAAFGFVLVGYATDANDVGPGVQIISGATGSPSNQGYYGCGRFEIPYSETFYWKTTDTTANKRADITGWTV